MPDEDPTTRLILEKDGKNTTVKWVDGDVVELAFVQDGVERKREAIASNISSDGKVAQFNNVALPTGIDVNELFDVYGVYGGGGVDNNNPTNAILPTNAGTRLNLADVAKDVMLYFEFKDYNANSPTNSTLVFKHLGSLFSITLKNTCINSVDVEYGARLTGVNNTGNVNWAYNAEVGSQVFDLETKTFLNTPTAGNFISFNSEIDNLPSGDTMIFWAWYPPLPDKNWPELQLELRDSSGSYIISTNKKPARLAPTVAGKTYNFYALWDGTVLNFTNDAFVVTP